MGKTLAWLLLFSFASAADDRSHSLSVDQSIANSNSFAFANDKNLKPRHSSFSLLHYVLMSNELGERWAVITVKNVSSGNRTFEHEHLMALLADGSRRQAAAFSQNFKGEETLSLTVNFGKSKFPVLQLYVETKV